MARTIRNAYTGSKRFDKSCRAHGGCGYCEGNRTVATKRAKAAADAQTQEWSEFNSRHLVVNVGS